MKHVFLAFAVMFYAPVSGTDGGAVVDNPDSETNAEAEIDEIVKELEGGQLPTDDDEEADVEDAQSPGEAALLDQINDLDDSGDEDDEDPLGIC